MKKAFTLAEVIITIIIISLIISCLIKHISIRHISIEVIKTNPKIEKSTQYDYNFAE